MKDLWIHLKNLVRLKNQKKHKFTELKKIYYHDLLWIEK